MYQKLSYTAQAKQLGNDLEKVVGRKMTAMELWIIVKMCKLVRRSCRSNTAFNNAMCAAFPYASFREVQKSRPDGSTYPGLQITVNEEKAGDNEEDE